MALTQAGSIAEETVGALSGNAGLRPVVFVHDNFVQSGGGERVAEALARCFPEADIVSTVVVEQSLSPYLRQRNIKTTWLQRFPAMKKLYRHYFLFYPLAARSLDLSRYPLVISSCYGFAKMVRKAPGAVHICYCHTPTRWVWRLDDYLGRENFSKSVRWLLQVIVARLKKLDLTAARNVDLFIANSTVVQQRIQLFYGRHSELVYPPIDVARFQPSATVGDFYLVVSRLVGYKRIDLAIQACEKLGRPLIIVGNGPDSQRLIGLAGTNTQFLGRRPDAEVASLMSRCRAFLFPGEEDFGISPLEANASGRPCIAYGRGGALDTIVPGLNGVHFDQPTESSLIDAMERFETMTWDSLLIRRHAEQFDNSVFSQKIARIVGDFTNATVGAPVARPTDAIRRG